MIDVNTKTGYVRVNHGDLDAMAETCALDVADLGGELSQYDVADLMGTSRQRIDQLEGRAFEKLEPAPELVELSRDFAVDRKQRPQHFRVGWQGLFLERPPGSVECKPNGRYRARRRHDGKQVNLGTYATEQEAWEALAAEQAEE